LRLVFTSDLHGQVHRYDECLQIIYRYNPDLLLLGGDLLPHGHGESGVDFQIQFLKTRFKAFLKGLPSRLQTGIILGNDDWAATIPHLRTMAGEFPVILFEREPVFLNSIKFAGYSYVPPTPFSGKDFDKRDKPADPGPDRPGKAVITDNGHFRSVITQALLEQRTSIEEDLSRWNGQNIQVLIAHAPPFRTFCDRLRTGQSVGSHAVREWILKNQPLISLHGHIHEAPSVSGQFWDFLGNTLCVNAGQSETRLSAVIVELHQTVEVEHTIYGPVKNHGERI
jgi:Icc-related predicted phosphoesterase